MRFSLFLFMTILLSSCSSQPALYEKKISTKQLHLQYNLDHPNLTLNLSKELMEISALSYDINTKNLLAVNDEKAKIYFLDIQSGKIQQEYSFGKKGDYEGIELIDNLIYIVKSNGHIFSFNMDSKTMSDVYKTPLSTNNDIEGLGYYKNRNELILACKAAPNLDKQPVPKHTKAFYTFNLDKNELNLDPLFIITDEELKQFFKNRPQQEESKKTKQKFEKRLKSFSPSAIAQHPINSYFYILSSVGKLLIVADERGRIKDVQFLNPDLFAQPEGICFHPDGTMYISNEGRSLVAKIFRFNYNL